MREIVRKIMSKPIQLEFDFVDEKYPPEYPGKHKVEPGSLCSILTGTQLTKGDSDEKV